MGNPLEEQNDLVLLHNRNIEVAELDSKLFEIGKEQYGLLVKICHFNKYMSVSAPIRRNSFSLT
jgi:hypothetical protein